MKSRIKKGFSLIEFLIVIALIGILTAIATVSYGTIQKRSRDSRRMNDIKSIQEAFEQYFSDNTASYPSPCTDAGVEYLPNGMPTDPKTGESYATDCQTDSFCVCALLETGSGNATEDCSGTEGTWYCAQNTQ